MSEGLSDLERKMLRFEAQWWRSVTVKHDVIRREFDMTPVRYFQKLAVLIDKPEALEFDPVTVKALLRRRDRSN